MIETYKINKQSDAKCTGHRRYFRVGASTFLTNSKKVVTENCNRINADHHIGEYTGTKSCMINGPRHSSEKFKVLIAYREKYYGFQYKRTTTSSTKCANHGDELLNEISCTTMSSDLK